MGNYLDSLVLRSLGLGGTIRPRPVSLFEPLPALAAPPSGLPTEIDEEGIAGAAPALGRRPEPSAGPLPSGTTAQRTEPPLAAPELEPPRARPRRAADAKTKGRARVPATTRAPAAQKAPQVDSPAQEPAIRPPVAQPIVPEVGEARIADQTAPSNRATALGTRISAPGVIALPRVKRVVNASVAGQAQAVAPPETAPTVQVTIGRVEVRAMAAPAPSEPRPLAVPVLTLEEYLGRRGRGGSS